MARLSDQCACNLDSPICSHVLPGEHINYALFGVLPADRDIIYHVWSAHLLFLPPDQLKHIS